MMTLWLSNEEVEELLSMREYVDLVEEAHRQVGSQRASERYTAAGGGHSPLWVTYLERKDSVSLKIFRHER